MQWEDSVSAVLVVAGLSWLISSKISMLKSERGVSMKYIPVDNKKEVFEDVYM